MIAGYKQRAAAPGRATASKRYRNTGGCTATERLSCVASKDSKPLPISQLSLFDEQGNYNAARDEMTVFFDRLHELLSDQNPADRISLISCAYWVRSGESKETIAGLLKPRLRGVFEGIIDKVYR